MPYALFWKGKRLTDLGTFETEAEAITTMHIETTQMELAEYTPEQIQRWFTVRKVGNSVKVRSHTRRS